MMTEYQKEEQAKLRKKQNEFKKTEDRILELEDKNALISEQMSNPDIASNSAELLKLTKEVEIINHELEQLYIKWEELSDN